jgi:hypothetical protein
MSQQQTPTMIPYATVQQRPGVVTWFYVYAIAMATMYLAVGVLGVFLAATQTGEDWVVGAILAGVCVPLMAACAAPLFFPRRKWAWIYGLVLIAIGLSGCTLVAAIPLLIFWIKEDCKDWFNVRG